jgi:hypothetical protein
VAGDLVVDEVDQLTCWADPISAPVRKLSASPDRVADLRVLHRWMVAAKAHLTIVERAAQLAAMSWRPLA